MILTLDDGSHFDPTHLMHEGMENGFPVEGDRFDNVVAAKAAADPADARYTRGRLRWPGVGKGPPEDAGRP